MDDLERRVRDSLTRNLEPVGAFRLAPERMQRARRVRMFAAITASVLAVSLAASAMRVAPSLFERERIAPGPAEQDDGQAPVLANVRCTDDGAETDTAKVQPERDGVHIRFLNETNHREFFLRMRGGGDWHNEGGRLEPYGVTELTTSAPPGELVVGCFRNDNDIPVPDPDDPHYAAMTVVDPKGLWVPLDLYCGSEPEPSRIETDATADDDTNFPALAREEVPGLHPNDVVRKPGYPETEWHLNSHVVVRDGDVIAHLTFGASGGKWEIGVRSCRGSGIGDG